MYVQTCTCLKNVICKYFAALFLSARMHRAACQPRRRTTMTANSCFTGPTSAPLLAASLEGYLCFVEVFYLCKYLEQCIMLFIIIIIIIIIIVMILTSVFFSAMELAT